MINGRMHLLQQMAITVVSGSVTMQGFETARISNREKYLPARSSHTSNNLREHVLCCERKALEVLERHTQGGQRQAQCPSEEEMLWST